LHNLPPSSYRAQRAYLEVAEQLKKTFGIDKKKTKKTRKNTQTSWVKNRKYQENTMYVFAKHLFSPRRNDEVFFSFPAT